MKFELVSLDGIKFGDDVYSVVLPTASGEITVLPGHESLMSVLVPGVITIRRNKADADSKVEHFATYGGVLDISDGRARVLVDEATHGDEVNEAEAKKAHDEAIRLRESAKGQVELEHAQALVDRHAVRLNVAQVRRRHTRR